MDGIEPNFNTITPHNLLFLLELLSSTEFLKSSVKGLNLQSLTVNFQMKNKAICSLILSLDSVES